MPTLYVTEPGARLEKEYGRLLVTKEDEVLLAVPLAHVSEVVLMSGVGVTTPALLSLLDHGAGLTLIGHGGRLRGRLIAAEARNLPLRHQQYRCATDRGFCLGVGRAIVAGKLRNCRTIARRILRQKKRHGADVGEREKGALELLNAALDKVPEAADMAALRGLEGVGSRAYFAILRTALRPGFTFEKRTRRPPRDPANALLSLAYSLLTQALFTACEVVGLDPYDGFFHADKYGRPALALDLVEEFRPIVADSVVMYVINRGILEPGDFELSEKGGVYLTGRGLREFLAQFGRRLHTPIFHPEAGRALSYQKVFEVQARRLRRAIESGHPSYEPFLTR